MDKNSRIPEKYWMEDFMEEDLLEDHDWDGTTMLEGDSPLLLNIRGWRRQGRFWDIWRQTTDEARAQCWLLHYWQTITHSNYNCHFLVMTPWCLVGSWLPTFAIICLMSPSSFLTSNFSNRTYLSFAILFYLISCQLCTILQSDACAHFLSHPSIRNSNHLSNSSTTIAILCCVLPLMSMGYG